MKNNGQKQLQDYLNLKNNSEQDNNEDQQTNNNEFLNNNYKKLQISTSNFLSDETQPQYQTPHNYQDIQDSNKFTISTPKSMQNPEISNDIKQIFNSKKTLQISLNDKNLQLQQKNKQFIQQQVQSNTSTNHHNFNDSPFNSASYFLSQKKMINSNYKNLYQIPTPKSADANNIFKYQKDNQNTKRTSLISNNPLNDFNIGSSFLKKSSFNTSQQDVQNSKAYLNAMKALQDRLKEIENELKQTQNQKDQQKKNFENEQIIMKKQFQDEINGIVKAENELSENLNKILQENEDLKLFIKQLEQEKLGLLNEINQISKERNEQASQYIDQNNKINQALAIEKKQNEELSNQVFQLQKDNEQQLLEHRKQTSQKLNDLTFQVQQQKPLCEQLNKDLQKAQKDVELLQQKCKQYENQIAANFQEYEEYKRQFNQKTFTDQVSLNNEKIEKKLEQLEQNYTQEKEDLKIENQQMKNRYEEQIQILSSQIDQLKLKEKETSKEKKNLQKQLQDLQQKLEASQKELQNCQNNNTNNQKQPNEIQYEIGQQQLLKQYGVNKLGNLSDKIYSPYQNNEGGNSHNFSCQKTLKFSQLQTSDPLKNLQQANSQLCDFDQFQDLIDQDNQEGGRSEDQQIQLQQQQQQQLNQYQIQNQQNSHRSYKNQSQFLKHSNYIQKEIELEDKQKRMQMQNGYQNQGSKEYLLQQLQKEKQITNNNYKSNEQENLLRQLHAAEEECKKFNSMYEDLVEKAKVKQILLFYIFDTIIMLYKN